MFPDQRRTSWSNACPQCRRQERTFYSHCIHSVAPTAARIFITSLAAQSPDARPFLSVPGTGGLKNSHWTMPSGANSRLVSWSRAARQEATNVPDFVTATRGGNSSSWFAKKCSISLSEVGLGILSPAAHSSASASTSRSPFTTSNLSLGSRSRNPHSTVRNSKDITRSVGSRLGSAPGSSLSGVDVDTKPKLPCHISGTGTQEASSPPNRASARVSARTRASIRTNSRTQSTSGAPTTAPASTGASSMSCPGGRPVNASAVKASRARSLLLIDLP